MKTVSLVFILALLAIPALRPAEDGVPGRLTAAQIVEQNISARGGLAAWRTVDSMTIVGKIGLGKSDPQVSFVLNVKRHGRPRLGFGLIAEPAINFYEARKP